MLLCALLVSLLFNGCAATLLYNHSDWLILRKLDGYFDLSRPQKSFVSARLADILVHHRRDALPRYEAVLQQIRTRIEHGLTGQDLDWAFAQYDQLRSDLFARFAGHGTAFLRLVEDEQVSHLRDALRKRLAKPEALLRDGPHRRSAERIARTLALAKQWMGSLTSHQEQELTRMAMAFPDTLPLWYAHEVKRNETLIAVVESRANGETASRLYDWLVNQEKDADPRFLNATADLRRHITQLILAIDRLATPEQRRHVIGELDKLTRTIHGLSAV